MDIFFLLIAKILPLYVLILLGYFANKFLGVAKEGIAKMLIYIFAPSIVFLAALQAGQNRELFLVPILYFTIGSILCLLTAKFTKKIWSDGTEKVTAFSAGTGNTGYFGLPVCLALFGDPALAVVGMISVGGILYENTVGFYTLARASYSIKASFRKLLKLPSLYAFVIGLIISFNNITVPAEVINFAELLKGGYVPFGMMMIGLGLAELKTDHLDLKLFAITFLNKFLMWPAAILAIIFLDKTYTHLFSSFIYSVLIIESIMPIAANTVTFATELRAQPQKIALAVMVSTIFAILYIPLVAGIFYVS
ncbi:MAG: AEC family transporter [Patescibacteria group bacterium]